MDRQKKKQNTKKTEINTEKKSIRFGSKMRNRLLFQPLSLESEFQMGKIAGNEV
jgi:3-deoxy-D-arabino-heptulosonate 7-phosphate (DAHP) synthase